MKRILLIFAVILFATPALALTPDQIAQQQMIIQQQQEQARRAESDARRVREAELIRQSRVDAGVFDDGTAGRADDANAECPRFTTIEVIGNKIYSDKRIQRVTQPYIGHCVTRDRMTALQNDLTAMYIDRKYTLARVYFDQHRSKLTPTDCDIVFIVEEGIVNSVDMKEIIDGEEPGELSNWQKFRLRTKTATAVPWVTGRVFNLKDFEQGLDQINRLQSNNATMDIRPTPGLDAAGHSDITIVNNRTRRTTFFGAGLDNAGNKNVGEHNLNFNINQDNLLGLNDNIYIKYTTDTDFQRSHHYSQSIYTALSIPFGYWTFNSSVSWADYLTTVEGMNISFKTHGDTLTQTYGLDRVVYRSATYRTNLGATFMLKDTENWIRDMKSITGSRRASNVNIFWNNTIFHKYGTIIAKPSYQRGLTLFGSRKDPDDIYDTEPHLQYDMLKFYLYSSAKFDIGVPLTWNVTMDSQYSFQNLYGTDQLSLGGEYTVRGFRSSTISGDQGFYARNDFRVPIWSILPDSLTNLEFMSKGGSWSANNALGRTQIAVFGDYGWVRNAHTILPDPYNSNSGSMTGAGVGLHYSGKHFNWSLMYAQTLNAPEYLQTRDGVKKEEQSIYWRISATY
ncbi:MAG: hypothetical protein FWE52_00135 [Alphaproteobacteria bacterium]|nr:hypothetical protein [Alphaproteobacteria bacterium]